MNICFHNKERIECVIYYPLAKYKHTQHILQVQSTIEFVQLTLVKLN